MRITCVPSALCAPASEPHIFKYKNDLNMQNWGTNKRRVVMGSYGKTTAPIKVTGVIGSETSPL